MGFQPEDCLVIEDSIAGVSAAVAASMKVIGFLGGSHIKPGHEGKLMNAGVFAVIRSFEYLSNLISKE